ncbi:heme ABC transporter ATP-binding protein [Bradyrhizobium sp. ARR65]|uniref:heme ABC transporter ATP-binding protein n=1 Tax=Bradyrhizobium sp. ARR65 TaxID=1040989 RepID=UPI000463D66B|nr:heme ABC transporter ATP-binding protein [Bradyrhizobium sp. ARR65]
MTSIVKANEVSFAAHGRLLVDRATLILEPCRLTVVIGPNGAGKSTLLKLLTGELSPSRGDVLYGSQTIKHLPPWRLACKRVVMAQSASLAFPFRVHEVARFGLTSIGHALPGAEAKEIVAASLADTGTLHLADRDFQTLSGGEQQRVRFARVLCQLRAGHTIEKAQALFLDEPIASLDLEHQLALMDQARAIANDGAAVLAILHDLNVAASFADNLIVMSAGGIIAQGPPSAVITDDLVVEVFRVHLRVGTAPTPNVPFVLPQHHVCKQHEARSRFRST